MNQNIDLFITQFIGFNVNVVSLGQGSAISSDRTDAMDVVSSGAVLPSATPTRVSTVARKSTSNMFLRETMKEIKHAAQSMSTTAELDQQKEVKSAKTPSSSIKLSRSSSTSAETSLIPPLIPIMKMEDCSRQGPAE